MVTELLGYLDAILVFTYSTAFRLIVACLVVASLLYLLYLCVRLAREDVRREQDHQNQTDLWNQWTIRQEAGLAELYENATRTHERIHKLQVRVALLEGKEPSEERGHIKSARELLVEAQKDG